MKRYVAVPDQYEPWDQIEGIDNLQVVIRAKQILGGKLIKVTKRRDFTPPNVQK